jgi:hypothetical protein
LLLLSFVAVVAAVVVAVAIVVAVPVKWGRNVFVCMGSGRSGGKCVVSPHFTHAPPVVDRPACVQENVLLHFSLSADPAVRDVVFLRPVLGHKDLSDGECRVFG